MKRILTIILFCAGFVLNGQTITGNKAIIRTQLELSGYKVTGISNDSAMTANSIMTLPTQYAVRNYVQNYVNSHAASAAGSSGQVQYNNAGSFGALDSLAVASNPDRLGVGVPVPTARVDIQGSGSTSATNALRVRNSSGTNLLTVRNDGKFSYGSSGQIYIESFSPSSYYNIIGVSGATGNYSEIYRPSGTNRFSIENATKDISLSTPSTPGSYSGVDGIVIKGTTSYIGFGVDVPLATAHFAKNTTASTPSMLLSGTGYSGGTATTTKPTLLIEPTGTTSTGWSTSGTKLGVNAESGFTGRLMDLQLNGSSNLYINSNGQIITNGGINTYNNIVMSGGDFYWASKSQIKCPVNGNFLFTNNGSSGFGLLQLGTTTSSSPALKANGAGIDIRLADDSGYGAVQSLYDRFGSGSPESVVTAPVGAVYHRTDGGAGTSFYVKESGTGNTGWIAK